MLERIIKIIHFTKVRKLTKTVISAVLCFGSSASWPSCQHNQWVSTKYNVYSSTETPYWASYNMLVGWHLLVERYTTACWRITLTTFTNLKWPSSSRLGKVKNLLLQPELYQRALLHYWWTHPLADHVIISWPIFTPHSLLNDHITKNNHWNVENKW